MPLIDPERALWEQTIIATYGDCGARHLRTVNAWKEAANTSKK